MDPAPTPDKFNAPKDPPKGEGAPPPADKTDPPSVKPAAKKKRKGFLDKLDEAVFGSSDDDDDDDDSDEEDEDEDDDDDESEDEDEDEDE